MADIKKTGQVTAKEDEKVQGKDIIVVKYAELHSPIRFEGKTETHISLAKLPTLKLVYWDRNGMLLVIVGSKETHILPSAAVKDSVL